MHKMLYAVHTHLDSRVALYYLLGFSDGLLAKFLILGVIVFSKPPSFIMVSSLSVDLERWSLSKLRPLSLLDLLVTGEILFIAVSFTSCCWSGDWLTMGGTRSKVSGMRFGLCETEC